MKKIMSVIGTIIVGIMLWWGAQVPAGLVFGVAINHGMDFEFGLGMAVICGLLCSIVTEIIYIISKVKARG